MKVKGVLARLFLVALILLTAGPAQAGIFEDPNHRAVNKMLPAIESTTLEEKTTYKVQRGDTLTSIARDHQVSVQQLAETNKIDNVNLIRVGQELALPVVERANHERPVVHVVQSGDTLGEISRKYDVGLQTLARYNAIANPNLLQVGQDIVIPNNGKAVPASSNRVTQLASRQRKVTFMWPVQGVITSKFGSRWGEFHYGLDIAADIGTPVEAARGGVVKASGWRGAYGKTVIIQHDATYRTLYAHNSELLVEEGQRVRPGQVIAKVGSTGRSTGPHIHFEVHKNQEAHDPKKFLQ